MRALEIACDLIRFESITPEEAGAITYVDDFLKRLGFTTYRLPFEDVDNLYAVMGSGPAKLCFMGHTDVVSPGPSALWQSPPFEPTVKDGILTGRGAADMKGGIACFLAALASYIEKGHTPPVSLLITGDEEGIAQHGSKRVVEWLKENNKMPASFLVGEATNITAIGDMIKMGSRGSITGNMTVYGKQGHVAQPQLADNPIPCLLKTLQALLDMSFGTSDDRFEPTVFQATSIDVGNKVTNLIPGSASAAFSIRFNDTLSPQELIKMTKSCIAQHAGQHTVDTVINGEAYHSDPKSELYEAMIQAIAQEVNVAPQLSTAGGTSDARFVFTHGPVMEFGLCSKTIHKTNEQVPVADLEKLTRIYERFLEIYV